jgi:phosphopantetheinyl transferase
MSHPRPAPSNHGRNPPDVWSDCMCVMWERDSRQGLIHLSDGEVDVWLEDLTARPPKRFTGSDRVGADWLKVILSRYTGKPARRIRITRNRFGKPRIAKSHLHFSSSHSGSLAVCAVAKRPVGVDIERMVYCGGRDRLIQYFFCAPERHSLATGPCQGHKEFYLTWTCKEAYVKARGDALQRSFQSFQVSLPDGILEDCNDPFAALSWLVVSFDAADEYVGALVTQRSVTRVRWLYAT